MLKKAYVEITNRCNLACPFCPKTKRAPRTMSAQEFGLVLSRLEGYVQYVYLHVMGEPLQHPELTTLFAHATARDMKNCITTNNTLLQKRSHAQLAAQRRAAPRERRRRGRAQRRNSRLSALPHRR